MFKPTNIWKTIRVFLYSIAYTWCKILKRKTPWSERMFMCVLHYAGSVSLRPAVLGALPSLKLLRLSALKPVSASRRILPTRRIKLRLHAVLLFTTLILSCTPVKTIINSKQVRIACTRFTKTTAPDTYTAQSARDTGTNGVTTQSLFHRSLDRIIQVVSAAETETLT